MKGVALAFALLSKDVGVAFASFLLRGVAQVDNLNTFNVKVEFVGKLLDNLVVAQQNGLANAFSFGLNGCLEHGGVDRFGKDDALGM